jgi:hypothetical protein
MVSKMSENSGALLRLAFSLPSDFGHKRFDHAHGFFDLLIRRADDEVKRSSLIPFGP